MAGVFRSPVTSCIVPHHHHFGFTGCIIMQEGGTVDYIWGLVGGLMALMI